MTTAIAVVALVLSIALGVLGLLRDERIGGERPSYWTSAKILVPAQILLGGLGIALMLLQVSQ